MADAAAYLPDSDPFAPYFKEKVNNNLIWADGHADGYVGSPLGLKQLAFRAGDPRAVAMWMHNYLGWGLDRAQQQGFSGGQIWLDALAGFQAKLFTSDGVGFSRESGAVYSLVVREQDSGGSWQFLQTMAELGGANPEVSLWDRDYSASARLMLQAVAKGTAPVDGVLAITRSGTGTGRVDGSLGAIDCGATCQAGYAEGTMVALSADPDPGSAFAGWTGDPDCSDGSVSVSGVVDCTATFDWTGLFDLSVDKIGNGSGTVSSTPGGIDCGGDCQESYMQSTSVGLNLVPDLGSQFDGWSGDADCADGTVTMMDETACTATFNICTLPSEVNLPAQSVGGQMTFEACNILGAGNGGFDITGSGDVTFRAGNKVVLESGFSVTPGGGLTVAIEPE